MNLPPAARAVLHALACVPDGLSDRALLMVLPPLLPADAPPLPPRPQAILRRLTEQGWLTARPGGSAAGRGAAGRHRHCLGLRPVAWLSQAA